MTGILNKSYEDSAKYTIYLFTKYSSIYLLLSVKFNVISNKTNHTVHPYTNHDPMSGDSNPDILRGR